MSRIFLILALFSVTLLAANVLLGFALGDFGRSTRKYEEARRHVQQQSMASDVSRESLKVARERYELAHRQLVLRHHRFRPHLWLGVAAALVTLLVNCISVTYFMGTTRWCREVAEAYQLPSDGWRQNATLKRRSFVGALLGVLMVMAIIASGAASDPGASLARPSAWVLPHAGIAMLGLAFIGLAFRLQIQALASNTQIVEQVLAAAERKAGTNDGG